MIQSRLSHIFLAPHGSNRKRLRHATPYHVFLNGAESNGRPGPHLFTDAASGPRNPLHHDTMSGYGLTASSTAMAHHHHDNDCTKARAKRKARNREHIKAFSFHFLYIRTL
jgi:hypothetical protein